MYDPQARHQSPPVGGTEDVYANVYPPKRRCSACQKPLTYLNPKNRCFACQLADEDRSQEKRDLDRLAQMQPRKNSIPSGRMDKKTKTRPKPGSLLDQNLKNWRVGETIG